MVVVELGCSEIRIDVMGDALYVQITASEESELPARLVYYVRSDNEAQFVGE